MLFSPAAISATHLAYNIQAQDQKNDYSHSILVV